MSDLKDDYLTPQDWTELAKIRNFLEVFEAVTLLTEGYHGFIENVLPSMDAIIRHYQNAQSKYERSNPRFFERVKASWAVFDKYYRKTDNSAVYAAALVLHPARRTQYIRKNWKKEWQKPGLAGIKRLWETSYRQCSTLDFIPPLQEQGSQVNQLDQLLQTLTVVSKPEDYDDEYAAYISQNPIDVQVSGLTWWLRNEQRQQWPKLSQMAIDILSIPAMSDEPERVFSGGRRTITWERSRLGAETIEKVECLKHWIKSGAFRAEEIDEERLL